MYVRHGLQRQAWVLLHSARRFSVASVCGLDGDTEPCRSLADAIIGTQQSEADDGRTRNEQRGEVDGIECPNGITCKRLTRAINYLPHDSKHLPMSSSLDEVRSTVRSFGLRQLLERHRPQ